LQPLISTENTETRQDRVSKGQGEKAVLERSMVAGREASEKYYSRKVQRRKHLGNETTPIKSNERQLEASSRYSSKEAFAHTSFVVGQMSGGPETSKVLSVIAHRENECRHEECRKSDNAFKRSPRRKSCRWNKSCETPRAADGERIQSSGVLNGLPPVSSNDSQNSKGERRFKRGVKATRMTRKDGTAFEVSMASLEVDARDHTLCISHNPNKVEIPDAFPIRHKEKAGKGGSVKNLYTDTMMKARLEAQIDPPLARAGKSTVVEMEHGKARVGMRTRSSSRSNCSLDIQVETRGGKRERWERMEFLRQMNLQGSGHSGLESKLIPTR
jgi:hypothetical protein